MINYTDNTDGSKGLDKKCTKNNCKLTRKTKYPQNRQINRQNKQLKQASIQMADKLLKTCSSYLTGE